MRRRVFPPWRERVENKEEAPSFRRDDDLARHSLTFKVRDREYSLTVPCASKHEQPPMRADRISVERGAAEIARVQLLHPCSAPPVALVPAAQESVAAFAEPAPNAVAC